MTNNEKKAIIEKSALAYYSGFSGLKIKDIEYGIDDHIVFVAGAWYGQKIRSSRKNQYHDERKAVFQLSRKSRPPG